jgi:hypothetical protein
MKKLHEAMDNEEDTSLGFGANFVVKTVRQMSFEVAQRSKIHQ